MQPEDLSADELADVVRTFLKAGYARLPVVINGRAVPEEHPDRKHTPVWVDDDGFFRLWSAALFTRALDSFRATALLASSALSADASAHLRIGFDHMVAFGWVAAAPDDVERPLRIGRFGLAYWEKQLKEIVRHDADPMRHVDDLAFALAVKDQLKPPPNFKEMCKQVDDAWVPRLPALDRASPACFSYWYSYLFRGASAYVHPTSRGIEPVYRAEGHAFIVDTADTTPPRVMQMIAMLLSVQVGIASLATPWLIDASELDRLGPLLGDFS